MYHVFYCKMKTKTSIKFVRNDFRKFLRAFLYVFPKLAEAFMIFQIIIILDIMYPRINTIHFF